MSDAEWIRGELLEVVAEAVARDLSAHVGFDVTDGELTAETYSELGVPVARWKVDITVTPIEQGGEGDAS